jgi:hypothetical protein
VRAFAGLHWQLDLKAGTDWIAVGCMDKAPCGFHDGSRDGQAQPTMRHRPLIRANKGSGISVRRLARLKDRTQQSVWNARSVVFDVQSQPGSISGFAAALPEVDMNASHAGHRFGGILHKVHQDSSQVFAGHLHGLRGAFDVYGYRNCGSSHGREKISIVQSLGGEIFDGFGGNTMPAPRLTPLVVDPAFNREPFELSP